MDRLALNLTQATFLENLLREGVLKFGEFKTKSGRLSPFFLNFGAVCGGTALEKLAAGYASLVPEFSQCNNLFGPAYKGIPLAVALSSTFSKNLGRDITFTFNRKETKDHGEGGSLVGHLYQGTEKVVIVEDVLTAGTSLRESLTLLAQHKIKPIAAFVGIDRQEKGTGSQSARTEIEQGLGLPIRSVLSIDSIVTHLHNRTILGKVWIDDALLTRIQEYRAQYGGSPHKK